jgi:hypothetical protein
LGTLRKQLPEIFHDIAPPNDWDDEWIFVPIDDPELADARSTSDLSELEAILNPDFQSLVRPTPEIIVLVGDTPTFGPNNFPGAPSSATAGITPPPDAFAFYLPFHYFYPHWWGVYLIHERVIELARYVAVTSGGALSLHEALVAVRIFLYAHEAFHHIVESFATRLEVTHRTPLYKEGFQLLFSRTVGSDACLEEALATAYAYRRVKARAFPRDPAKTQVALAGLHDFITYCPPGYRRAPDFYRSHAFESGRSQFAELNHAEALASIPSKAAGLWSTFPHAFSGISRVTSRVNYMIRRNSPLGKRLALSLRYLKYRDVAERLRRVARCEIVRQGHGSHEIWRAPNGASFPVPRHPGDLARGTLAKIIKQSGLDMSLSEFVAS